MSKRGIIVGGGIGKHIAFSALSKQLAEKYGDIILVNSYPEVFQNNPYIYRNLTANHAYLYEDYLHDISVLKPEPYDSDLYRIEGKHIIDVYADILKIDTPNKKPLLFLSEKEDVMVAGELREKIKKEYILVQIFGGVSSYTPQMVQQKNNFSRDYPISMAQELVNKIKDKYPQYEIVQIRLVTEPQLQNVLPITSPITSRVMMAMVKFSKTFIAIDSCIQHISAAYDKKGIVLWGGTSPTKLGYEHNINIHRSELPHCKTKFCHRPDTYFADVTATGLWDCPYNYECMGITPDVILNQLDTILGGNNGGNKGNQSI